MNKKFWSSILFILLIQVNAALAQELTFHRVLPPIGSNPGSLAGVQDPQGYLWYATGMGGLHRYDGYNYVSYYNNPQNSNSLAGHQVQTLCVGRNGLIWIGMFGYGLDRLDPLTGNFTHYRYNPKDNNSLSNDTVRTILEGRDGVLWIGTDSGLDKYDPKTGRFSHYNHKPNDPFSLSCNYVGSLWEDRQGTLWVGTGSNWRSDGGETNEGGLNRLDKKTGKFTRYLHDPSNPRSLINNKVRAIFEDSRGTFWVGTAGDGLHTMDRATGTFERHRYDPAHPEKLSRPAQKRNRAWADDAVTFIVEDITGGIWIGTLGNGVNRYDPTLKKVTHYPNFTDKETGVQTDVAAWACTSREGVVWVGYFEGLYRIDPLRKSIPYVKTGRPVLTIYEEASGVLWYGTNVGLVRKDRNTGTEQHYVNDPRNPRSISNNMIIDIYEDRQGVLWICTGRGLNRFDRKTGTFIHYGSNPDDHYGLNKINFLSIYEDRLGSFWIATDSELIRLNRQTNSCTHYRHDPADTRSLSSGDPSHIYEDKSGDLWVGMRLSGLNRFIRKTGEFKHFLPDINIHSLWQDSEGVLWVGTSRGLYRSNKAMSGFSLFTGPNGEFAENKIVNSVLEDNQKALWVSTAVGICRISPRRNEVVVYSRYEDVVHFNGTGRYRDRQGELFFGGGSGYYAFFPKQLIRNTTAPQLVFNEFRLADQPVALGKESPLNESLSQTKEIHLRYNQNIFSFAFAGIHYSNPKQNPHLFRLEGLDNTWRKAGEEKTAYYYNVPPGHYTFQVKAANGDGVWAEKAIRVIIDPPWWRTGWFISLAAIISIGLIYSGLRYRVAQIRREEAQKTAFTRKLSETEMQALRAQMNPHFIFNSLNSINTFILKNEPDAASDYLAKFSRLIRLILQNSNSATVTLQNELEALQLYLEMESLRFRNKFSFQIRVGSEVEPEEIDIPPLLIQPYVENAIWHGLLHKESVGQLIIDLQVENDRLVCVIEDDGVGRRRAAELKSKSATRQKSLGMQITAHRVALMNELYGKQTTVDVVDLVDTSGEACGTRVVLTMSL